MTFKERLPIVVKYSQLHLFLLISFVYGIIFGGIIQIVDFINNEVVWNELIFSALATGGGYFCIFSLAMIGIYMGQSTKAFISLSMPRKMIIKLWRELTFLISLVDTIIIMTIFFMARYFDNIDFLRLMNMDLVQVSPREFLTIFVLVFLGFMFIFQIISLIANIGNNHGLLNMFSAIALGLALVFAMIVPVINLVVWGQFLYIYMAALVIVNLGLIHVNKRMLNRVEVVR